MGISLLTPILVIIALVILGAIIYKVAAKK
jgi:hypothetical protein